MTEKDYSLLRPFDLEAAKAGADLCNREGCVIYDFLCVGENFDGSEAAGVRIKRSPYTDRPYIYFSPLNALRLAPLCWVEGKPVYPGDALEVAMAAGDPVCFVVGHVDEDKCLVATNRNHFIPIADENAHPCLRWPRPKPVKRWINVYPNAGYSTKAAADQMASIGRIACIEIELPPLKP